MNKKRHLRPGEQAYMPVLFTDSRGLLGAIDALKEACENLDLTGVTLKWWEPTAPDNPRPDVEVKRRFKGYVTEGEAVVNLSTELESYVQGRDVVLHEVRHLWQMKHKPWMTNKEMEEDAVAYVERKNARPRHFSVSLVSNK